MIYKFDSFWSYLTNEPSDIMDKARKLLTKSDYDFKREQWNITEYWKLHSYILGVETIKFPTGFCEYLSRELGLEIDHKKKDFEPHDEQEILEIANKVKELCPTFEVRDYQLNMALIPCSRYASFIVSSTSSGKTSTMTLTALLMKDKRILVMNNQNFILKQIYDRFIEMGIPKEDISTGTEDLSKRIVIISSQTSYNRIKESNPEYLNYLKTVEAVMCDECFIQGTKISTPCGYKNIEEIKENDEVLCFDINKKEIKTEKVTHTFKHKSDILIQLIINNKTIICTSNHPFYTNQGWKTAKEIYDDPNKKSLLFLVQERNNTRKINTISKNDGKERWIKSLFSRKTTTRQEKNIIFKWVRLDSIKIQKQRNKQQFVYNIEVDKYNNYFAQDILVHNCQHLTSPSHFSLLFYTENLEHLIGYTGSPYKNPNNPYKNIDDSLLIGLLGEPAVEFTLQDSIEGNNVAQPYSYFINYQAYPVEYPVTTPFFIQYRRAIIYNRVRNKAGIEMVKYLNKRGIKTLVLFRDVKNHGLKIMQELVKQKVKCLFLQGGEKIHEYDENLKLTTRNGNTDDIKAALNSDYNIILASQVMDEGVDISLFQAGVLFTGGQSPIKIIQQTGRVARKKQGKENIALMIDFNDSQVNKVMDRHYKTRKKTLLNNGVIELPSVHHLFDIIDKMAN